MREYIYIRIEVIHPFMTIFVMYCIELDGQCIILSNECFQSLYHLCWIYSTNDKKSFRLLMSIHGCLLKS